MQKFNLVIIYTRSHSPLNMGNICNANDGDVADAEERMVKSQTKNSSKQFMTWREYSFSHSSHPCQSSKLSSKFQSNKCAMRCK